MNRPTTAAVVGSLFFPRSAELGLAVEDTVSPRVLAKVVHAGTSAGSFTAASQDLLRLANLSISAERVRRACQRIGGERIEHQHRMQHAFEEKPLPVQLHEKPAGVEPPPIACVMCDGGRYQLLDRSLPRIALRSARKGEHWKESRIGLLLGMSGPEHTCDPQPTLPPELRYEAIAEKLSEIGRTGKTGDLPQENGSDGPHTAQRGEGLVGPELEQRGVVASRQSWEEFGARSDDPRVVVRTSMVFYENHAARMDYPNYRRAGLPLTSSLMESAVKQVSRRVKGTEKFWSSAGGEAMLRLRGEALSDDEPLLAHMQNRARHATGQRTYRSRNELLPT